jgi:hypothetical protein
MSTLELKVGSGSSNWRNKRAGQHERQESGSALKTGTFASYGRTHSGVLPSTRLHTLSGYKCCPHFDYTICLAWTTDRIFNVR